MSDINSTTHRVLVCITPQVNSRRLINEAAKIAASCGAELHVLNVQKGNDIFINPGVANLLESLLNYAGERGGIVHCLSCKDKSVVETITDFVESESITKLVLGEPNIQARKSLKNSTDIISCLRNVLPDMEAYIIERPQKSIYTLAAKPVM